MARRRARADREGRAAVGRSAAAGGAAAAGDHRTARGVGARQAGADGFITNKDGLRAYDIALSLHFPAVRVVIKPSKMDKELLDRDDLTNILAQHALKSSSTLIEALEKDQPTPELVNSCGVNGVTVLMVASATCTVECVNCLLDLAADPLLQTLSGCTVCLRVQCPL